MCVAAGKIGLRNKQRGLRPPLASPRTLFPHLGFNVPDFRSCGAGQTNTQHLLERETAGKSRPSPLQVPGWRGQPCGKPESVSYGKECSGDEGAGEPPGRIVAPAGDRGIASRRGIRDSEVLVPMV